MATVYAVTSGKGGVGKTTAAAAIGAGLAAAGKRTVLIDMDIGLRNLDVALGLETLVFYHIGDVLKGTVPLEDAMVSSERFPGLALLAAAQSVQPGLITPDALCGLIEALAKQADCILIDCPAGIGEYFRAVIPFADEGIVVTTPVVSAVRDADKVLHLLEEAGARRRRVIVNALRPELVRRGAMMAAQDITDVLGAELLGIVPDDDEVIRLVNEGRPVSASRSPAGAAYDRIVRRLLGEDVPFPPLKNKKKGWLRRR